MRLTHDAFLGGRVRAHQPAQGYRAGTDAVLLAAAVPASGAERVLEAGCGAGVAALCLLARVPQARVTGLEIEPAMAGLARRNGAGAIEVVEGDLLDPPPPLRARVFDHVMTNPPYHDRARSVRAPALLRERAMGEAAPIEIWLAAALARLRSGGWLTAILPAARLGPALAALEGRAGGPVILPVAARAGREAGRVVLRARKGARAPLRLLAPLVMHEGAAHDRSAETRPGGAQDHSAEALAVLRDGAALPLVSS